MRARHARKKGEWKTFLLISTVTAVPLLLTLAVLTWTNRPDLYFATPPVAAAGVLPVSWRTLGDLIDLPGGPVTARPDLFGSEVRMLGYMLEVAHFSPQNGAVSQFLLVPATPNWQHPQHIDSAEVVHVRLQDGRTAHLLDRTIVAVQGRLSFEPARLNAGGAVFHLSASTVEAAGKVLP